METKPIDAEKLEYQVGLYREARPVYEAFAQLLTVVLTRATKELGIAAIVQARAKDISSFAGKIARRQDKYADPINQFTDLCGARVIVGYKDQIEPVCNFIRRHFEIDEANSEDVIRRLGVEKFGYAGVHLIVTVRNREEFSDAQEALLEAVTGETRRIAFETHLARLAERRTEQECRESGLPLGSRFKAEIQVRTLLQHAWAECAHDRVYKSDFELPGRWRRDINRIAAALEEADESFVRAIHGVESYRTYYGAYLTRQQRKDELTRLEAVLKYDPDDAHLAQRIARLALSVEDWDRAGKTLAGFVAAWERSEKAKQLKAAARTIEEESRKRRPDLNAAEPARRKLDGLADPQMAGILLDFGVAVYNEDRERASSPFRPGKERESGRAYIEWATYLDPWNVDARVALAETFVDDPATALEKYELAFTISPMEPRVLAGFLYYRILVERTLDFVSPLRPTLESAIATCRERARLGIYLPHAYYNIGLFALVLGRPYESLTAYARATQKAGSDVTIQDALNRIERLQGALKDKLPELDWVRRFLRAARAAELLHMADTLEGAKTELGECLCGFTLQDDPRFDEPIVIVAGGTDEDVENRIKEYESLLQTAFKGFSGTVFGGGTAKGISGLVGRLPSPAKGSIRKVAYVRQYLPVWAQPWQKEKSGQEGYELYCLEGSGFSPLEPIQTWVDLLASGADPRKVKLLGINGGQITAFEFRLALVMGAQVGVIGDSGRSAREIFEDEDWKDSPGLVRLPNDPQSVKVFVQGIHGPQVLEKQDLTILAKRAHEEYRAAQNKPLLTRDPAAANWESLPPDLQNSNIQQVAHIEEKLRAVGLKIRKLEPGSTLRIDAEDPRLKDNVEIMAEIEHGRWVVERLLAGWKPGPKEVEKKTSPYLVAWSELPEWIKDYDRSAVRAIPKMLAELGYEIIPEDNGGA